MLEMMMQAFQGGQWTLFAGLLLSGLVAAARYLKALDLIKIPDAADGWIAMGLAMVASIGLGLQNGQDWLSIVTTALTVGAAAVGGWELLLKRLRDRFLGKSRVG